MMSDAVVLLDDRGAPIGRAGKTEIHHESTPLHLAFSCHVVDTGGRVLITRRALGKRSWPGVWTNSFCGHPSPGERIEDAVVRRCGEELDLVLHDLRVVLPDFRYRAIDPSGVVENEVCPVYLAVAEDEPRPDADEVIEHRWVPPTELASALRSAPWAFSPWMVLQARGMSGGAGDEITPAAWTVEGGRP
jgi:isopentenyl-diphosphate delta-isomerase